MLHRHRHVMDQHVMDHHHLDRHRLVDHLDDHRRRRHRPVRHDHVDNPTSNVFFAPTEQIDLFLHVIRPKFFSIDVFGY